MACALGILPKNPKERSATFKLYVKKTIGAGMKRKNKAFVISARFNEDEYLGVIMKITDESGSQIIKLSDFARASILSAKVVIVDSEIEKYRVWVAASVGNNINQIARRLNTDNKYGAVTDSTYIEVLEQLNVITSEMNKLLEPLK